MRNLVILWIVCLLLGSGATGITTAAPSPTTTTPVLHGKPVDVYLNSKLVEWGDALPFINEVGRTMIPARFFSETIGATVIWSQEEKRIIINLPGETYKDFKQILLQVGTLTATVNFHDETTTVTLDATVWQEPDKPWRTYVPLRFVSECAGCLVDWSPAGSQSKIFPDMSKIDAQSPQVQFIGKILEKDEVTITHFLPVPKENDYIIVPGERMGKYRLDWPIEQYEFLLGSGELGSFVNNNYFYTAYSFCKGSEAFVIVTVAGKGVVYIRIGPNRDQSIENEAKRYHTREGLGGNIKATAEKLISIYGQPYLRIPRADNPRYVNYVFGNGVFFELVDNDHIVTLGICVPELYPYTEG